MVNKIILKRKIREFLEEDCSFQDVSSEIIPENEKITARIITKSSGFISGLKELAILFEMLNVKVAFLKKDGDAIKENQIICNLIGNAHDVLLGERVSLNILTRMSAITTSTRDFIDVVRKQKKETIIACTRKNTPGFRIFEKRAVKLGGGDTHRWSLDDMVLIKDTHRKFFKGDVGEILAKIKVVAGFSKKIEIEVETLEDVVIAAENGADIIMLDNMNPTQIQNSIDALNKQNLRESVLLEASGGITIENIEEYVKTGVDIISLGALTQFPHKTIDLSLEFD